MYVMCIDIMYLIDKEHGENDVVCNTLQISRHDLLPEGIGANF